MNHLGTIILDDEGKRLTLAGVVEREVSDLSARKARRNAVREACWDAVDSGAYADFDYALAAYVRGEIKA